MTIHSGQLLTETYTDKTRIVVHRVPDNALINTGVGTLTETRTETYPDGTVIKTLITENYHSQ